VSAFSEDLKRWMERQRRPHDGAPSAVRLRARDVVILFWRHGAVWPTAIYRMSAWCHRHGVRALPTIFERLNLILFGIEISPSIPIGPGLYIAHPVGTVLMAQSIGANASFIAAVTLGMRETREFPILGDGVMVGAGARILGGITLGDGCTIGANAVVIADVPPGATAVGVPARVLPVRSKPPDAFTKAFRK
jgi:serine O-acetyltransferase